MTDYNLRLKTVDVDGNPMTPASESTLAQALTKLGDIFAAVDGLELTAGNIELNGASVKLNTDEVEALLRTLRDNLGATTDSEGLDTLIGRIKSATNRLIEIRDRMNAGATELIARMLNSIPASGYKIAFDPDDASHTYILEAPQATAVGATGWRGIRIPKTPGPVQQNTGATLTFNNRASDANWS